MPGLRLSLSYGCQPNLLGLCGPQEEKNKKIIFKIIRGKKISNSLAREIAKGFRGAYPYYQLIAQANNLKDPLSEKAVRAYWTGSDGLEQVRFPVFERMAKEKFFLKKIPPGSLPHHSFHVLNIGRVNGKLKESLLDYCLVKWGRVKKINGAKVLLDNYEGLENKKNIFYLASKSEKVAIWDKSLLPNLKIGDWVSIHWKYIIEKLNREQLANLKKYTGINIKAYADSRKKTNK